MEDIEKLSELMDSRFKIGPFKIGLDGLMGLIPGVGDLLTSLVSFYIIFRAFTLGASVYLIIRMLLNVFIEYIVGFVPFLGNLFDFIWKSNLKNVELLKIHLESPVSTKRNSGFIVGGVFVLVILLFTTLVYLSFKVLALVFGLLMSIF